MPMPPSILALVAHADLTQVDAGAENAGELLQQLAEIDAAVRREVKHELCAVKRVFRIDEVHIDVVFFDAFAADGERFFFFLTVLLGAPKVFFGGDAHQPFERGDDFRILDHFVGERDFTQLDAAGGFNNDLLAELNRRTVRIERINFAQFLEPDTDDFSQCGFLRKYAPVGRTGLLFECGKARRFTGCAP